MSYDVWITIPACDHCGADVHSVLDINYTSNLSRAWDEAGAPLRDWDGKSAAECAPLLRAAIAKIDADRAAWYRYNPPNGWGHIDSMVDDFLAVIAAACERYPRGTLRVGH